MMRCEIEGERKKCSKLGRGKVEAVELRVISSNGRAIALHAIGRGIDAPIIHFCSLLICSFF